MSIHIVTDSTCDLPQSIVDELDITVIPLYINAGGQGYLDGVTLGRTEFYQRLPEFSPLPTTAAPGQEVYRRVYEKLAQEGASEILSIHISASLSATVTVAQQAAQEFLRVPVTVLDGGQLSLGTGFLVETAAKAARAGKSLAEILALLSDQAKRTYVFAALDTVEFLRRSGRISWAMAGLAGLLHIKPLLRMNDGHPTSERVRTWGNAVKRLLKILSEIAPLERLALVHTNAPEKADELRRLAEPYLPAGEILSADITPVIGAHIGPGAAGFACIAAPQA